MSLGTSLDEVARAFAASAHALAELGLASELDELREALEREEFRIAMIGRFKAGKSQTVNALLELDVSPSDVLPCTAGPIEFARGSELAYFEVVAGELSPRDHVDFARRAGSASAAASDLGRWRVTVPTPWMVPGLVLVDTPGTDEDDTRLAVARAELGRADAVIVVVRADQVAALDELDLVEELRRRVGIVLVVVNRMDLLKRGDRERLLEHARARFVSVGIPADRVVALSAARARYGEPEALGQVDDLRAKIGLVLERGPAGARVAGVRARLGARVLELAPQIEAVVEGRREQVETANRELIEAQAHEAMTVAEVAGLRSEWQQTAEEAASRAASVFAAEWPRVVRELGETTDQWTSELDPLFSPKAHAEEVGARAKSEMESLVRDMLKEKIEPVLRDVVDESARKMAGRIDGVLAGIGSADDLMLEALTRAFPSSSAAAGGADAAVAAAVSAVIGYIVADVILFYVLAIVSGFFNPVILVTAAVAGVAVYFFMGREWVAARVRSRIASALSVGLADPTEVGKMVSAVRQHTRAAIDLVGDAHHRTVEEHAAAARRRAAERIGLQRAALAALEEAQERSRRASELLSHLTREVDRVLV